MTTPTEPTVEKYLTPAEAAAICRLSLRGLQYRRLHRLGPPCTHVGRLVRYPLSKLLAWLESNTDEQSGPVDES